MKIGQEPIRLNYKQGVFRLEAHLLICLSKGYRARADHYRQLVRSGLQDKWKTSFPVDDPMEEAIVQCLQARCPEALPGFLADLAQAQAELPEGDLVPRMTLEVFVSEAAYQGWFPQLYFARQVLRAGRRPLLVYVKDLKFRPSHVQSALPRRIWGIFRDGRVISLGFNWHYRWPGLIRLAGSRSPQVFKREAAHEFGHTMGLGDAYAAWYRSYDPYPASESYLMHSNRILSPEEIRMMFQAQASGKLQHFPYQWSWKKFWRGFRRELQARYRALAKK